MRVPALLQVVTHYIKHYISGFLSPETLSRAFPRSYKRVKYSGLAHSSDLDDFRVALSNE
jgi:hypothetical protein